MKTRVLVSISIPILICILLIGGCATTAKPAKPGKPPGARLYFEPTNEDSSLVIGRITLTAENFPSKWRIKGDYTNGIVMHLRNFKTNEIINVRSRGADGFLHLLLDTPGQYEITGFFYKNKEGNTTVTLRYRSSYPHLINIKKGTVNNLGDMHWIEKFEETAYKAGGKSEFKVSEELRFIENYDQVKEWFQKKYLSSAWNNKNWINV
jgi:hypothetical protein